MSVADSSSSAVAAPATSAARRRRSGRRAASRPARWDRSPAQQGAPAFSQRTSSPVRRRLVAGRSSAVLAIAPAPARALPTAARFADRTRTWNGWHPPCTEGRSGPARGRPDGWLERCRDALPSARGHAARAEERASFPSIGWERARHRAPPRDRCSPGDHDSARRAARGEVAAPPRL